MRNKNIFILLFISLNISLLFPSVDNSNNSINNNNTTDQSRDFNKAYDISIGGGLIPTNFNTLLSKETFIDFNSFPKKTFYMSLGISIPFSFSYFFNNTNSIGFIVEPGYLIYFFMFPDNWHNFILNTGIKYKYGNENKKTKLLIEASYLTCFELFYFGYYVGERRNGYLIETNFFYISFGPKLLLGLEYHYKKFSFEFGGYIGALFDPINSYIGDNNYHSYYYHQFRRYQSFVFGIQLRYNFYYFKKIR